jgi:hypothetical protein
MAHGHQINAQQGFNLRADRSIAARNRKARVTLAACRYSIRLRGAGPQKTDKTGTGDQDEKAWMAAGA